MFFDTLCVSFSFVFLNFLFLKLQFMRIKTYIKLYTTETCFISQVCLDYYSGAAAVFSACLSHSKNKSIFSFKNSTLFLLVHDKYPQFQFSFKNNLWCNFNYNILHGFTFCTCTSSSSTGTVLKYYYYYNYYYVTVRLVLQEKMRWHFSERWEWSDGCVALR